MKALLDDSEGKLNAATQKSVRPLADSLAQLRPVVGNGEPAVTRAIENLGKASSLPQASELKALVKPYKQTT